MAYKITFTDFSNRPNVEVSEIGTFETEELVRAELSRLKSNQLARASDLEFTTLPSGNGFSFAHRGNPMGFSVGSYEYEFVF